MLRLRLTILAMVLAASAAWAAPETTFDLSTGYRVDQFRWSIAGNAQGTGPDTLSELTWRDLQIAELKGRLASLLNDRVYLRFSGDYGVVFGGTNQDSDYNGNDRTLEFSRSDNKGAGQVWDASLGMGWQFRPGSGRFRVTPLIGYAYDTQNLGITDGSQTIPPSGGFSGLNSHYEAVWRGPWVGADWEFASSPRWSWLGSAEYHWIEYHAWANWNLRTDFAHPISFQHDATGRGTVLSVGGRGTLSQGWTLNASIDYQSWSTSTGNDRTHFADGGFSDTQFNGATWKSFAVALGLVYRW